MDINFEKLFGDDEDAPTNPRDIFLTLDKLQEFSFLRDIQSDVLDAWYKQPDDRDAVIKLNVGSGKTLVGLLILQSSLNAGVGPAVFVCPDNFLVEQVVKEAERLGIDVTTDANDYSFRSGGKILVANIYKLFNGRSVFGVGSAGERIGIGSIVIDDAHACLQSIIEQFRVHLPNTHPGQKFLLQVLRFFRDHGVKVLRIMTGNGAGFRSPGSRKSIADAAYLKDPKKQPVETRRLGTCQR